jgi:TolB protein
LTSDNVRHWYPSIAPEGGSVVFSAYRMDNVYEIYELDFFGTQLQLTDGLGVAKAPEISPDGSQIVFGLSDANGSEAIWLMDRDGGNPHELYSPGWDPTWSPDGGYVLFASLDANNSIQLFTIDRDGSGMAQVTHMNGLRGRSDWAPDGALLATYVGEPWEREIFLFRTDGSGLVQFTSGGNNLAPSFSPDGAWLAMTSYRDQYRVDTGCEIYVARLSDAYTLRLTYNDTCDWQPRWGP